MIFAGKVGGLTDLTGAAAANGLLVGLPRDPKDSTSNGLYGPHSSNTMLSSYSDHTRGKQYRSDKIHQRADIKFFKYMCLLSKIFH